MCRAKKIEDEMQSPEFSEARKELRKHNMRKNEANFLRFLRTVEKQDNYNTLKVIGKGAFGEVKLVQRKHDGKIYALKSLIKTEMVSTNRCLRSDKRTDAAAAQKRPARSRPGRA